MWGVQAFWLFCVRNSCIIISVTVQLHLMIQVTRKDSKESSENLLRRFNRKVQQAGTVAVVKSGQYFEKPISKRDRRLRAIVRQERKALKVKKIKLGQR
jgi:ribosomal protein S21